MNEYFCWNRYMMEISIKNIRNLKAALRSKNSYPVDVSNIWNVEWAIPTKPMRNISLDRKEMNLRTWVSFSCLASSMLGWASPFGITAVLLSRRIWIMWMSQRKKKIPSHVRFWNKSRIAWGKYSFKTILYYWKSFSMICSTNLMKDMASRIRRVSVAGRSSLYLSHVST